MKLESSSASLMESHNDDTFTFAIYHNGMTFLQPATPLAASHTVVRHRSIVNVMGGILARRRVVVVIGFASRFVMSNLCNAAALSNSIGDLGTLSGVPVTNGELAAVYRIRRPPEEATAMSRPSLQMTA